MFVLDLQPSQEVQQQQEEGQTMSDLRTEIAALRQQHDAAQHEIRTKEDRINQLIREIHNLVNIASTLCLYFGQAATIIHEF